MIAPNTIIGGRYRVVRLLGGGGMKLVYLAEDLRLAARPCALAEMVDSFTSPDAQQAAIAGFQREADMLARLSNEHIPRVIDRFSEANHHYLVMEYIEGVTLEDQIKRHDGKLPPKEVIEIAIQVLETLEYLHNLMPPVIYRDLKPSNVMIGQDGRAKLIDFGIARFFAPLSNATMIGTQGYAPPEQYRGKVEARSDLYALGATMHHALSGRDPAAEPPFSFPPLRKVAPDMDPALAAVVDQALSYDVVRRLPDAAEFKRRLLELGKEPKTSPSAATVVLPQGKAQLKLPLEEGTSRSDAINGKASDSGSPAAAAHAATALAANAAIKCPRCARTIPLDSRFCSYCSAPLAAAGMPNDSTVILSPMPEQPPPLLPRSADSTASRGFPQARRRSSLRGPLLILIAIAATAFLVARLLDRAPTDNTAPSGYGERAPEPPNPGSMSPLMWARMTALRQALDANGYHKVQFRLEGDILVLSGTIPSEDDRPMVRTLCFNLLGFQINDSNLRAEGSDYSG